MAFLSVSGHQEPASEGCLKTGHWCAKVMRSRLEPMKRVARTLRHHQPLIRNWFVARGTISGGIEEGCNNKAKLSTKKAYAFRELKTLEVTLYHQLGNLPEPEYTNRFR